MTDNKLNTLEKWVIANLDRDDLAAITEHGASGGYSGLIYLDDTNKLYDEYHECIWKLLKHEADNMGLKVMEMINNFVDSHTIEDNKTFKNKLVLVAVEIIAHRITEQDGVM